MRRTIAEYLIAAVLAFALVWGIDYCGQVDNQPDSSWEQHRPNPRG